MSILNRLASASGRRDEVPNRELAREIVSNGSKRAIGELVENLNNGNKAVQNDCIKVLYEVGELKPILIVPYTSNFLALLAQKNNRLQWGGMIALNCIVKERPGLIYANLPKILEAADTGSVITKDHTLNILMALTAIPKYGGSTFELLREQLLKSSVNQFPMYAERSAAVITEKNKKAFLEVLDLRLETIEKESARKRIEKIQRKLTK